MPPKGQAVKDLDECFRLNDSKTKIYCVLCTDGIVPSVDSSNWILLKSSSRHVKTEGHEKIVRNIETARMEAEERERIERVPSASVSASLNRDINTRDPRILGHDLTNGPSAFESNIFANYSFDSDDFIMGDESQNDRAERAHLQRDIDELGLWNSHSMATALGMTEDAQELEDEVEEDEILAEMMENVGKRHLAKNDFDDLRTTSSEDAPKLDAEYHPYDTKTMFLLDTLDNLPRLRISHSLMRVFLWILKETGARDVPSFDRLRKIQKKLRDVAGIPTIPCESVQGNIFFLNDPRAIIANDWANPTTRKHIHLYPEIPEDGIIREIWHGQKWRNDFDLDMLSPMYDAGRLGHFYVNELARMADGSFVIPKRWVTFRGAVYANALSVVIDTQGFASVPDTTFALIAASKLTANYPQLIFDQAMPVWKPDSEINHLAAMPNPKRELAGGDPLYVSFIDYFGDDVSGNRSKSWNKHWNAYMTHRNLPRQLLQQEFHVHFISSSPNASITEQYLEFKAISEETHRQPVKVHDASTDTTTRFCITVNAGPSDNPMQAEISGSIGGKGNYPCRKCDVGGTQAEKREDAGFEAMFEGGVPRSKEQILAELEKQVRLACDGVAQPIKDSQTGTGIKDMYTQYWIDTLLQRYHTRKSSDANTASDAEISQDLVQWVVENRDKIYSGFLTTKGFDPTRDTPVEILHTILLGIVKYIWHSSHTSFSAAQKKVYAIRLQSTNTDALSIHAIRSGYIMQYAGSLIGRQFKTLVQTSIFHIRDLVTDKQFAIWRAVGELSALLWVPAIRDFKEYVDDLKTAVANVLDAFAALDPTKIISKIKLHLLSHTVEDATAFGPLVGVATEIFECFNAIFRFCSILSNHLSPSRDIALQLADQEALKHRLTGGWWSSLAEGGDWTHAGPGVQRYFKDHRVLQQLVGWSTGKDLKPGTVKLVPLSRTAPKHVILRLADTDAKKALNYGTYDVRAMALAGQYAVSESSDECLVNSWVFFHSPLGMRDEVIVGRITCILARTLEDAECNTPRLPSDLVCLEVYQISATRDPKYGMPVLTRRNGEVTYVVIPPKDIKFKFNVQHDCETAKCEATGERPIMQERRPSGRVENFIVHKNVDRYLINTHAFHNADLLRATLPRHLTVPIPLHDDRAAYHRELASDMRKAHGEKKKAKEAKAREKAAGNLPTAASAPKKKSTTKRKRVTKLRAEDSDGDDYRPAQRQRTVASSSSLPSARPQRAVRASWRTDIEKELDPDEYDDDAPGPDEDTDLDDLD